MFICIDTDSKSKTETIQKLKNYNRSWGYRFSFSISDHLMWFSPLLYNKCKYIVTSSSPVSWAFGWRQVRPPSRSLVNVKHNCHLTRHLRVKMPWLHLTHSWWTWARLPRRHLRPRRCDGGGDGGQKPGPPHHPVAPLLPVATEVSCWPHPHLIEKRKFHWVTKTVRGLLILKDAGDLVVVEQLTIRHEAPLNIIDKKCEKQILVGT